MDKEQKWKDLFGSEWSYVKKLGEAIHDPHSKKEFWENVKARKLADAKFSIYSLFPRNESATVKAREECINFVRSLRHPGKKEESA